MGCIEFLYLRLLVLELVILSPNVWEELLTSLDDEDDKMSVMGTEAG